MFLADLLVAGPSVGSAAAHRALPPDALRTIYLLYFAKFWSDPRYQLIACATHATRGTIARTTRKLVVRRAAPTAPIQIYLVTDASTAKTKTELVAVVDSHMNLAQLDVLADLLYVTGSTRHHKMCMLAVAAGMLAEFEYERPLSGSMPPAKPKAFIARVLTAWLARHDVLLDRAAAAVLEARCRAAGYPGLPPPFARFS